ncbi:hypothetical protein A2U01_0032947, partial [Trifolium medium]|nr:hypothetical protein [Trifolium medium]
MSTPKYSTASSENACGGRGRSTKILSTSASFATSGDPDGDGDCKVKRFSTSVAKYFTAPMTKSGGGGGVGKSEKRCMVIMSLQPLKLKPPSIF